MASDFRGPTHLLLAYMPRAMPGSRRQQASCANPAIRPASANLTFCFASEDQPKTENSRRNTEGGCARAVPWRDHRSVRAQLRHTARQVTVTRCRCVIRWRFVYRGARHEGLVRFPANGPVTRHPLPLIGSLRFRFPDAHGTMKCSDSLRPSRRTSFPSFGATRQCACAFAPSGPRRTTAGRGS